MADYLEDAKVGLEYASPRGNVFTPLYQITSLQRPRKNKSFEFIDVPGTLIQDLGMSFDRFKLRLYFVGPYHHKLGQAFLAALSERGNGRLTLPLDEKDFRVVIPIDIKQETDHVEFMNRTTFEVEFRETIGAYVNPGVLRRYTEANFEPEEEQTEGDAAAAEAKPSLPAGALVDATKQGFKDGLNGLGDKVANVSFIKGLNAKLKTTLNFQGEWVSQISNVVERTQAEIEGFRQLQADLFKAFEAATSSIDQLAEGYLETPLILASQIQSALNIPNFPLVENLIGNYETFIEGAKEPPRSYGRNSNDYLNIQTTFSTAAISALAISTANSEFTTRQDAIDALDEVKTIHEGLVQYLEDQEAATAELPLEQRFTVSPAIYGSLNDLILSLTGDIEALTAGLRQTVTYTVVHPTTPVNLAAKHYPQLFATDANAAIQLIEDLSELQDKKILLLERGDTYKVLI